VGIVTTASNNYNVPVTHQIKTEMELSRCLPPKNIITVSLSPFLTHLKIERVTLFSLPASQQNLNGSIVFVTYPPKKFKPLNRSRCQK
jgi:hypothetical protein